MVANKKEGPVYGRSRSVMALIKVWLLKSKITWISKFTSNIKVSTSSRMSRSLSTFPSSEASINRSRNAKRGLSVTNIWSIRWKIIFSGCRVNFTWSKFIVSVCRWLFLYLLLNVTQLVFTFPLTNYLVKVNVQWIKQREITISVAVNWAGQKTFNEHGYKVNH